MSICNIDNRTIFLHDNIEILRSTNSECIDLIYLDPPFNKNKKFTAPIGSSAEGAGFDDIFREEDVKSEWLLTIEEDHPELFHYLNGIKGVGRPYNFAYLAYMAIRLIECKRVLKSTGSLYLHCDPTMSHYLKTVMDCVMGERNFRNEIVWQRHTSLTKGSQHSPKTWGTTTDTILYYANPKAKLRPYRPLLKDERLKQFPLTDERGERYYNDSAHIWSTPNMGARPNLCYSWRGFENPHPSGWRLSKERLEEEYQKGNIVIRDDGRLERRKYERDFRGKQVGNLWRDIPSVNGRERKHYPTQKPLALLARIIEASSNEGDLVLDPFCGCATTCVAAENTNRQWIGIDISQKAYDLVKLRLEKEVAHSDELPAFQQEIHLKVSPPKRTDLGASVTETKFVYIISHPKYHGDYKVGVAKDVRSRLNSYQTSDPDRSFKLEFSHNTHLFRETERHIHEHFENRHEWVTADLKDIKREIIEFSERSQ